MSIKIDKSKPSFSEAIRKKAREAEKAFEKWMKSNIQKDQDAKK